MSGGARRGANKLVSIHESDVTAIGSQITLEDIDITRPHCFLGVQFFADAAGTTLATPTAGLLSVKVKTFNTRLFEAFAENQINAAEPVTISWAANTLEVLIVPSAIDVATHYKVVLTANES